MRHGSSGRLGTSPITADAIDFFRRLFQVKDKIVELSKFYAAKSKPSIWDRLLSAYFRTLSEIIGPPLPPEDAPIENRIWKYWEHHEEEFKKICDLGSEINSYLSPLGSRERVLEATRKRVVDLLPREALYKSIPAVDKIFAATGAPVKRRPDAVRALQMQIDTGQTWTSITQEVCGCPKKKHDQRCTENVRQSVNGLKRFLRKLDIELPKAKQ